MHITDRQGRIGRQRASYRTCACAKCYSTASMHLRDSGQAQSANLPGPLASLKWKITHRTATVAALRCAALQEVPGREAPAAWRSVVRAGGVVGHARQEVHLGPLDGQPAVIHQAASIARVGVPVPASHATCSIGPNFAVAPVPGYSLKHGPDICQDCPAIVGS